MKHSWTVTCKCGTEIPLQASGSGPFKDTDCPKCFARICIIDDGIISQRVLNRSLQELQTSDFTFAIILSAMAVEYELSRLFIKWKAIDLMPTTATPNDEESWDEELRKAYKILARLDLVSQFLTKQTFDVFLANDAALTKSVQARHPDLTTPASKYFESNLFWKRNQIVHARNLDSSEPDAQACHDRAYSLFLILSRMDGVRYNAGNG